MKKENYSQLFQRRLIIQLILILKLVQDSLEINLHLN